MGLTRMYLSSRYWCFGRTNGSVIADRIRLRRDGTIEGHSHPNEARWGLDRNQTLIFYRQDGVATTRFGIERLSPKPAILKGVFLFDENITHTLTEKEKVPLPKHVKQLPWILLVRPNLGQPLLLSPDNLESFEITFAGTSELPPHPNNLLRMLQAPSLSQPARITLTLAQNGASVALIQPKEVVSVMPYSRSDEHDPPRTAREHQYRAGFRWEARVRVGLDSRDIVRLGAYGWPKMFDIKWWHRRKEPSFLYHSVYVSNLHEKSEINFLHVTDTHVARRNDLIPEVLSETRDSHEARRLRLRYNNFNDNLRAVIRFANKEKVDFMAVTGDLVDYYHDGILVYEDGIGWFHDYQAGKRGERGGWLGNPAQADSNVREFVEIVTGQDGRGEALKCPIFCIPGNHDYLRMEPPLALKAKFYILFFPVRDVPRGPESWGLDLQEGAEFEFWKKTKGDSLVKRLKRLRDGEGFDPVEFSTEQAVLFTTPEFDDTAQYITEISYDTDFCVKVGSHRLVCLNTGEDVFIPDEDGWTKAELVVDRGDTSHLSTLSKGEKHFLDGQSHNRGILPSHLEMITEAVSEAKSIEGLTFVFTHAPLVRERKPGDFDTSRLQWNMAGTLSEDEYCHFDSRVQDRNSIPGLDGSIAEWDSHILVSMVRWIQLGAGGVDAVFSGHSHDIKEYRLNKEAQVCSGKYSQGVSTTPTDEKEKWLREHSPLQLISGKLKGQKREFRHVVIKNSHIRSMGMREIPRFYQQDTSRIGFFFTVKSIELARFGGYTSSARNDLNPATHLNWAQGKKNRLAVMWDLMEKYLLQLVNVEYLESVLQSEGRSSMPQHLREKLERVEAAIEDAIPKYARIVGRYPETDWWYDPQDPGLPYGRRRNQFYAICAASLNEFGVDFGSSEKNSLDLKIHYEWSRKKRRTRLLDALEERIGKLFEFAHAGPSHLLAMWYASESVHLAPWSAWNENPDRGRRDPGLHLRWALTQSGKAILDDLCETYEIAAKSQYRHLEERGLKEFYIYHSVRMAAWGASVGQPREDQADPTYFEAEAERLKSIASDAQTWVDLIIGDLRNRAKMITYSLLEPGYQPQNRITLNDGNSYDFSERTSGMSSGGDFYLSELKFLADNVGQRGVKGLGDIGTIPLDQVDIPKSGYTRFGVPAVVGHTYVSLAQEGEEGGYIVFRVHSISGESVTIDFAYLTPNRITLNDGNSYDFSEGTSGMYTGGDFFLSGLKFLANNVDQRGTKDLGDIGTIALDQVDIPKSGYTRQGVSAAVGHTYVSLAQEGEEGGYIVFRVHSISGESVTIDFAYLTPNRITLNDGNSYDFSEGTSGMYTGGDFFLSGLKFLANNVDQRGTKDLGDIGTIALDQVDIPKSGYTRQGVSAAVGHTYVSLAQEGEEGGYIVFRVHSISGESVTIDFAYLTPNRITLNDGNSYDFSEGTSGMYTGGDFFLSGLKFLANNVDQRGTKDLGDIGTIALDQVDIPKSGYTRQGVSAAVGHTYVSLAQEGEEGGYIVFRVHSISGERLTIDFAYLKES